MNYFKPMVAPTSTDNRKQAIANMLMQRGTSGQAKHPFDVLANMLNAYTGAKVMKQGETDMKNRQQGAQNTMMEALAEYRGDTPNYSPQGPQQTQLGTGQNQKAMLAHMMTNPDTAGMASQMQIQQAMAPPSYGTATVGVEGKPDQRQQVFFPNTNPAKYKPLGPGYRAKAQTEINMGTGQPPSEADSERKANKAVSEQVGAPLAIRAPWANIGDPKERDKARVKYGFEADKRLGAMESEAKTYADTLGDIDRFLYLNKSNYTGKVMDVPGAKAVRSLADADFQEMQSITDKMTPGMRQGLPGSASERDTAMFRSATLGTNKDPEANENVGLGLKVSKQNGLDKIEFMKDYKLVNQHLEGAGSKWNQYIEANPIFDPNAETGSYTLNNDRMTYKKYFLLPMPEDKQSHSQLPVGAPYRDRQTGKIVYKVQR